jgi:ABC-2 type transport system permease protein
MTETAQNPSTLILPPLPDSRPGAVFSRTLRDNMPGIAAWGLGYSALIVLATVLYPLLDESNTVFTVLNGLGFLNFLSAGRDVRALTGFAGYLALQAMSWGPLILAVYTVPQALRAVAHEERQGTLDILLSTPISRWRFLMEKALAVACSLAAIAGIVWLSIALSTQALSRVEVVFSHTIASAWHLLPITLVMLCLTLLLSVTLRDSRRAGPLAAALIIASYFTRVLSDFTPHPVLEALKPFSMFSYYRSVAALDQGFQWDADLILLGAAAVLFVLALLAFQRRDLCV